MAALAETDLDTLTPEQAAAARQALAALETLRTENETLAADKACLAAANDALTEEKACLAGENEALSARIRRLEHLNLELVRLVYGKRSEKLSADERQLAFEELEGASAEVEAEAAADDPSPPRAPRKPRPARNLGHLPEHLERIEQVIEPESTLCPCGCGEMVKIGEDRAERLDIVPAQLRVIVTVRPKYACRRCEEGRHPGAGAGPADRGRAADRRRHRACADLEIRRALSPVPPGSDLRPVGAEAGPLDAGRLGRQGGVPPRARV